MTSRLLLSTLLLLGFLTSLRAQSLDPAPLHSASDRARPTSPAAARRATALALPFFDDFAGQSEGNPSADRWEPVGGALINNRFAVNPPSRGVATLDGLDAQGNPYGAATTFGTTDSLVSQPLDLSALQVGSRTFLSFFWQTGNILGAPTTFSSRFPVFLELEFLDRTGQWVRVWRTLSPGQRTDFRQRFIAVDDVRYFHANFRFRFRSSGRKATTQDSWSVDYVLLDTGRDTTNTAYRDVTLSRPLNSLFKRYASLPVWQYNAAANPTLELNDSVRTTLNNLDAGPAPTPVVWRGTTQVLPTGPVAPFFSGLGPIAPLSFGQPLGESARSTPLPVTADPKRVRYQIFLTTDGPPPPARTLPNDTVTRVAELADYFAFDDGTPEAQDGIAEPTGPPAFRAYRLVLNRADQIKSLRIYLTQPLVPGFSLTAAVWDEQGGQPTAQPKATKAFQIPATIPPGQSWLDVQFDQPVPVSGVCYFGYGHNTTSQFIRFGLDLNSQVPRGQFWRLISGVWQPFNQVRGAPMMRAVMTGLVTSTRRAAAADAPQVFPNPSPGLVQVQGRYQQARVLDALGRLVWQQPAAQTNQATLDLQLLPAGLYLLQLSLPDGAVSTHRLVLEK
ncbi:T9SS type A sorting domain-containing protein [Hymenobacter sp. B81]|uniref:T9SS type A sorting domain-containing protein n=1 Tax=Hymenobacter sp. B81 TaxID=3344878 RepID=UPI0037DD9F02